MDNGGKVGNDFHNNFFFQSLKLKSRPSIVYFTLRFRSCLVALHELGGTLSTKDINVKEDIDLK